MDLLDRIDRDHLPRHIAVIMDGNGRWAKARGKARVYGHKAGVESVNIITETCSDLGIKYLTLYAFSTENWNRPEKEVTALMELLVRTLKKEINSLKKNNVKVDVIGNLKSLPDVCYRELDDAQRETSNNTGMNLILALSYSGRWDLVQAARKIAAQVASGELKPEDVDETRFADQLATKGVPDPELLIRTSGEYRISNFLLWQTAYSELYFTPTLWPDFRADELYRAIIDYQQRERRFGKTSEQIKIT